MNTLRKETLSPQTTIIDQLTQLLGPGGKEELDELYIQLLINEHVLDAGRIPTKDQFREYFQLLLSGFEYMRQKYGMNAIPSRIILNTGLLTTDGANLKNFFGYDMDQDAFSASFLHVAITSSAYDNPTAYSWGDKLPKDRCIRTRDFTKLISVEEGYHCYQRKALNMPKESTIHNSTHPRETAVIPIVTKAINDLRIHVYQVDSYGYVHS